MLKEIECCNKTYIIKKLLGHGKGGYSYLAENNSKEYVLKQIHHEPCEYYKFGDKLKSEVDAFTKLDEIGIRLPKLLEYSKEKEILIKEYIEGQTLAEIVAASLMKKQFASQILEMTEKLYPNKINIDYFPTNFVVNADKMYYIDYEYNNYMEEWNFENWGIYYLANESGMRKFLKTGDHLAINKDSDSGKPIKEPFETIVYEWLK